MNNEETVTISKKEYESLLEDHDVDPDEIDITAFKEDVLARNLYSFTYDW